MSEGMIAAVTGLVALVLAFIQWWFALRAAARQRDAEMTQWGGSVISVMAELESLCCPIADDASYSNHDAEVLAYRLSALVDCGRLFFLNVKPPSPAPKEGGIRVKILDEVLIAFYVAQHAAGSGDLDRRRLRAHVWSARKRFVKLLQSEMGMRSENPARRVLVLISR